jgi:hypothetical protein
LNHAASEAPHRADAGWTYPGRDDLAPRTRARSARWAKCTMLSVLAVLKLMTISNRLACCTGRSAGFAPLSMASRSCTSAIPAARADVSQSVRPPKWRLCLMPFIPLFADPETGRRALYPSPNHMEQVVGFDRAESNRCWTSSRRTPRSQSTNLATSGARAMSSSGTIAAPCTKPTSTIPMARSA